MKTPKKTGGFTLIELLVVIAIIAILAGMGISAFPNIMRTAHMSSQMNNGRQIYLGLRAFAADSSNGGSYPAYNDPDDANTLLQNSNDAFEVLLPRYLDDKNVFNNKSSAWCKLATQTADTKYRVMSGENDWVYVRGLKDSTNSKWPLLANAFVPGTTTYITDTTKKGGVWKGDKAVVIWAGGSAEVLNTKASGDTYFVKRTDKPNANAFERDDDWLGGEDVQILYPQSN